MFYRIAPGKGCSTSFYVREQFLFCGVYGSMTCACAFAAYLGLALPLVDGQPRTIEFESVHWDSTSLAETYSLSGTIGTSSDGSRMNTVRYTGRRFILFKHKQVVGHSIYIQSPHASYIIDDEERIVHVIPCMCDWKRDAWPVDADCSRAAKKYDPGLVETGSYRVAGVSAFRYRTFNRSYFTEVGFSPALHCDVVEEFKIVFGRGTDKYYSRFKVTKYFPGEPPVTMFRPPSNYRFEIKPR